MLFDLIDFTPIVIQVIVGAILLMGILKGLKDGIIVMGVRVGMYVVIFLAIKFLTPTVSNLLSNIGFLDGLIEKIASINVIGEMYGTLAAEAIYSVIAAIVILIVGLIASAIICKIIKPRKFNLVIRGTGALVSGLVSAVIAGFILVVVSSPLLFANGDVYLENAKGVNFLYKQTVKVQDALRDRNMPASVEDLMARYVMGKDINAEDMERFDESLPRIMVLLDDPEEYVNSFVGTNGQIDDDNAEAIVSDLLVLCNVYDKLPLNDSFASQFENTIDSMITNTVKDQTIEVEKDLYEDLQTIMDKVEFSDEFVNKVNSIVIKK